MAYEQKDNSGSLFRNERKEKDTHPDHTGTALIDGREYWVSAWIKTKQDGGKFFSMAFKSKDEKGDLRQASKPKQKEPPLDDEIPF
jgi:hypothetical protein